MARRAAPPAVSDTRVRALLDKYHCPVPFHAVRTRILGHIASPAPDVSPTKLIEAVWGGELPVFDSIDDANELFGALMMGLWNRLTRHQELSVPFRLTRIDVPATREGLRRLATTRQEELHGFREGLFGANESLDLPEQAHKAVAILSEIGAMLEGTAEVASNPDKSGTDAEAATLIRTLHELTRIAEHEIHRAVRSCARARRQMTPPPRGMRH
ncbi:MAG: hypothetical protein ABSE20_22275 [Acetobacteraceae bacterium]|jgi:hypothetical protein